MVTDGNNPQRKGAKSPLKTSCQVLIVTKEDFFEQQCLLKNNVNKQLICEICKYSTNNKLNLK